MSSPATIAALATAPQPAGVAVIRVSGSKASSAMHAIFRGSMDPVEHPRYLCFGRIVDYQSGAEIDTCLAVFMPGPNSFTGEDIAEFQFHGSPIVAQRILRTLLSYGVSPAEPGEFTKRAFLNGKMDLVQAEAIADLINAKSEAAVQVLAEQLSGKFSNMISELAEPLRDAVAELEASIDFPEEDIEPDRKELIISNIKTASKKIDDILKTYDYGSYMREGFKVLICGRPNAGKSSLLNRLLGRPRAIVTEVSGTTRDLLEEQVSLGGFSFVLCDSAGIHDADDKVEKIGIDLAIEKIPWADLVLVVADATAPSSEWQEVVNLLKPYSKMVWLVVNKIDANPAALGTYVCDSSSCRQNLYLSAKTGSGIDTLIDALIDEVKSKAEIGESQAIITNERHRQCLNIAHERLESACADDHLPAEIVSAEVRAALNSLANLVGSTSTEDILGRIFSKFCIGK
jgi:tRNA modification GTPase